MKAQSKKYQSLVLLSSAEQRHVTAREPNTNTKLQHLNESLLCGTWVLSRLQNHRSSALYRLSGELYRHRPWQSHPDAAVRKRLYQNEDVCRPAAAHPGDTWIVDMPPLPLALLDDSDVVVMVAAVVVVGSRQKTKNESLLLHVSSLLFRLKGGDRSLDRLLRRTGQHMHGSLTHDNHEAKKS